VSQVNPLKPFVSREVTADVKVVPCGRLYGFKKRRCDVQLTDIRPQMRTSRPLGQMSSSSQLCTIPHRRTAHAPRRRVSPLLVPTQKSHMRSSQAEKTITTGLHEAGATN